jgi:Beta propeller domain
LLRYSGACPSCVQRAPSQSPAGRLSFSFASETRMTLSTQLSAATAAGTHPSDSVLEQLSRPASARAADRQLARFVSDSEFRSHMEAGMLRLFPPVQNPQYLGLNFSPAPAPSAVAITASGTNLQEAGVDEADLVKLSGNDVWTFAHNNQTGARLPQLRRARLTPAAGNLDLLPAWNLLAPANRIEQAGLYAGRDRMVAVTGNYAYVPFGMLMPFCTPSLWRNGSTDVEILDNSTPDAPVRLWHARLDGFLIASRRIGDDLYLVTRHVPEVAGFDYYNATDATRAANRTRLSNTSLSTLLPGIRINGGASVPLVSPMRIFAPPQGARGLLADVFAVTVISLAQPGIRDSLGVMGTLDTIYMSPSALYLASARNAPVALKLQFGLPEPTHYFTDVHKVQFNNGRLTLAGSGSVEGFLDSRGENAPFRMSEQDGRLRIVTSSKSQWSLGQNRLTVLEPSTSSPGLLRTASFLPNAQRPATLGKPGELLYATRFDGNRLYAVTFMKTDPLYVVDLSQPADPVITGELEVTGYSDYLHPLGNGLLLGVGLDARPAHTSGDAQFAWFQGLQLTLFDVSNNQKPRELQKIIIGKRGSNTPLLNSHHAFSELRMADGSLSFAFPATLHESAPGRPQAHDSETQPWAQTGLLRFSLKGSTPADARIEQHPTLVSHAPPVLAYAPGTRASNGRSILTPEATLFINDGQFWIMRKDGTVLPTR